MPKSLTYDEKIIIEKALKRELKEQEVFRDTIQNDYENNQHEWSSTQIDAYHYLKNQADKDISNILSAILKLEN